MKSQNSAKIKRSNAFSTAIFFIKNSGQFTFSPKTEYLLKAIKMFNITRSKSKLKTFPL